jgi:hypothetical protein
VAEKITASLGHINGQKNVTSAREDDKERGMREWNSRSAKGQHERAKKDRWIVETLNSGSGKKREQGRE